MSVLHIFGDGIFELTILIPYKISLAGVQMLLCPNLLGFTLMYPQATLLSASRSIRKHHSMAFQTPLAGTDIY